MRQSLKRWFYDSMISVAGLVAVFLLFASCQQNKDQSNPQAKRKEVEPSFQYEITSFQTSWKTVSRGLTALDGMLWVPEIRMTVKNTGTRDIDIIYFRAVFLDAEGVIKGDDIIESVSSIPAGYAKGPVFLYGTVGYTSDFAFLPMMKDNSQKWRFDLFVGNSYSGPWTKIKSGLVELPEEYRRMR
ncbi:MAG: hypothetical protein ABIL74_07235 [candidate division WOR-3 bacterium]